MKSKPIKKKPIQFVNKETIRQTPVDGLPRSILQNLQKTQNKC